MAMAEIAFVNDIRGVWSSRDTRVTTPSPINVASMNTNRASSKVGPDCGTPSEPWAKAAVAAVTTKIVRRAVRISMRKSTSQAFYQALQASVRLLRNCRLWVFQQEGLE